MKKFLPILISVLSLLPLGCASRQEEYRPIPIIDLQSQKGAIEQTAKRFISAFFDKNQEQVLKLSGYPFYMDDGGILNYPQEWKSVLDLIFANPRSYGHKIARVQIMTGPEIPSLNTQIWSRLLELKYHQKIFVYAQVDLTNEKGTFQENVLLILDLSQESGEWRVLGFFS
jgi:hypothetical protein